MTSSEARDVLNTMRLKLELRAAKLRGPPAETANKLSRMRQKAEALAVAVKWFQALDMRAAPTISTGKEPDLARLAFAATEEARKLAEAGRKTCPTCAGAGGHPDGERGKDWMECDACGGSGFVAPSGDDKCARRFSNGSGGVRIRRQVTCGHRRSEHGPECGAYLPDVSGGGASVQCICPGFVEPGEVKP